MSKVLIDRDLLERAEVAFNSGLCIPHNSVLRVGIRAALAAANAVQPTAQTTDQYLASRQKTDFVDSRDW